MPDGEISTASTAQCRFPRQPVAGCQKDTSFSLIRKRALRFNQDFNGVWRLVCRRQYKPVRYLSFGVRDFDDHLLGVRAGFQNCENVELIGAFDKRVLLDVHGAMMERCEAGQGRR